MGNQGRLHLCQLFGKLAEWNGVKWWERRGTIRGGKGVILAQVTCAKMLSPSDLCQLYSSSAFPGPAPGKPLVIKGLKEN